jgi:pseudouridine-5'-phosphate glycosidase
MQRCDTAEEVAAVLRAQESLGLEAGTLVTVPVPRENEIPREQMEAWIEQAVRESVAASIAGKNVTPWLLNRIFELTNGRSLDANIALIKNNAAVAAAIAKAL